MVRLSSSSLDLLCTPAGHRTARFLFIASPLSLPSSCLLLPSVWSSYGVLLCWSISWTYHRTDRTSKQQSCLRDSARALNALFASLFICLLFLCFVIYSSSCIFFSFSFSLFFRCTYITMDMFLAVSGCKCYGMVYKCLPHLLRGGTTVFFSSICSYFLVLFRFVLPSYMFWCFFIFFFVFLYSIEYVCRACRIY